MWGGNLAGLLISTFLNNVSATTSNRQLAIICYSSHDSFSFTFPTNQPTGPEIICTMGIVDREEEVHLHQSLLAESSSKNTTTTTTDDDQQNTHLWSRVWIESKKLWRVVGPAIIGRLSAFSMIVITQAFAGHLGVVELASISIANNVIVGFTFGLLVMIKIR